MHMLRHWLDGLGAQGRSVVQRLLARMTESGGDQSGCIWPSCCSNRAGSGRGTIWLQRMLDDPDAAGDAALMRLERRRPG